MSPKLVFCMKKENLFFNSNCGVPHKQNVRGVQRVRVKMCDSSISFGYLVFYIKFKSQLITWVSDEFFF